MVLGVSGREQVVGDAPALEQFKEIVLTCGRRAGKSYTLALIAVWLAVLFALAWRINLLALPEDEARSLGVNTAQLRMTVIAVATLATSASVAVSGIVGWVGLVVPHMARLVVGPEFSRLLPVAALFGAAFMLMIDTLARTLTSIEIPPGILTAVIGTPVFIALLARTRRL